jgi:hypothetical protein
MVEVDKPSGDPADWQERGEITMFASTLPLFLFIALATAGMRGWTADSRDVEYRLWPLAPAPAALPCHKSPGGWNVHTATSRR